MRTGERLTASVEDALRQAACALRPPDLVRVERVCRRVALEPALPGAVLTRRTGYFRKPLLRVAAVLLLLAGAALFSRWPARHDTGHVITFVNPAPLLDQMGAFTDTRVLTQALTTESLNIVSDLAMLATAINEHSFAILF